MKRVIGTLSFGVTVIYAFLLGMVAYAWIGKGGSYAVEASFVLFCLLFIPGTLSLMAGAKAIQSQFGAAKVLQFMAVVFFFGVWLLLEMTMYEGLRLEDLLLLLPTLPHLAISWMAHQVELDNSFRHPV